MQEKVPVSVLVLTKNEQQDLPGCLESVRWADEVVVFDSFSTDATVEVAERKGARVVQRQFDNWSSHQNWALSNIEFRNRWVLYIDADERVSAGLMQSVKEHISGTSEFVAMRVRRRDFMGKSWLKHVQASSYYIRLFMPQHVRYERLVNPYTVVDGQTGTLSGYLDHYPFSKGLRHWIDRHNSYSTLEAAQIVENRKSGVDWKVSRAFFARDINERRFHQKELFIRLPARPLAKFLLLYVLRGGFLDGRAGFTYAILQSMYEQMIVLKTYEATNSSLCLIPDPERVFRPPHDPQLQTSN